MDVEGSLYHRNRVDLQVSEQLTAQAFEHPAHDPPEALNAPSPTGPCKQGRVNTTVISEGYHEDTIMKPRAVCVLFIQWVGLPVMQ